MTIGEKIKELREKKGLSQRALSLKCDISNATISRIEQDAVYPELETLIKIAKALQVDIDIFLKYYSPQRDDISPYFSMIARGAKNLTQTEQETLLKYAKEAFPNFSKDNENL
ncbi:MAG: helix-turn-helix domain-containing protein [Firmicutes bacterium]|nr:helix-turn-helix domain-containing protein [Bacillota bacterium]